MEIHSQLTLTPGALDGTKAPAFWTVVVVLALVALVCGLQAWLSQAPPWTELPSFDVEPLRAVELYKQRTETFATKAVSHGEALVLRLSESTPPELLSALLYLGDSQVALRIHADLTLGAARRRALSHGGLKVTVSLVDKQIVRIASADGELLRYREFQDATRQTRWWLATCAGLSAAAAAALAFFARRLLAALSRRPG